MSSTDFTFVMPTGTSLAFAKSSVLAQLPPDAVTQSYTVVSGDSNGSSCAFWDLTSTTLSGAVGDPGAVVNVELASITPGGTLAYDVQNIDQAAFSLGAQPAGFGC
jgi:hypothetical protein